MFAPLSATMKSGTILLFIIGSLFAFCAITTGIGCANMVPPTGGPRDSIPPQLRQVTPPDSSKDFNTKKISFVFNEYVQVDNATENLLISPTPKINPTVEHKLRTVTVTLKDTLEPNTTYSIDFGNAIKDINEGNVLKNFMYIFSTGASLDTLELSGTVIMAETGKADSTLVAALYRSGDDSIVYKEKPRYITRIDRSGNFRFRNLPGGTYWLYAFKDESGSRRYTSKQQVFAFAMKPMNLPADNLADTLFAYVEEATPPRPASTLPARTPAARGAAAERRLRLEANLENGELDLLKHLEFTFKSAPIKEFDSTKIVFADEQMQPLSGYQIVRDTGNTKITLIYPWKENTAYNLIVDKDFASDTAGRKLLKSDTFEFRTKKQSAYGEVRLRFPNLDLSKNPVLQFIQNSEVKHTHIFTNKEFNAKLFVPGDYDLRILFDDNKNGKWDPGEFFGKRKPPEIVLPVSRRLTVKANWENEIDISL